jgi:hypothetical protein
MVKAQVRASTATEVAIPLALLVLGLAIYAVAGFQLAGAKGAGTVLILVGVQLVINIPCAIAACYITVAVLGGSFGYLRTAIFKLSAILVFGGAIALVLRNPEVAGTLAALAAYLVLLVILLVWLFELEWLEAVITTIALTFIWFASALISQAVALS